MMMYASNPDIFVLTDSSGIRVKLNESFCPNIDIDIAGLDEKDEFCKRFFVKQGLDLIDALEMRKSTLYKK